MVNFRDPNVIELDYWALIKLCYAVDGLYIWEFVTSLDYEWSVIQRRRPYRWTIWIYSITRIATLMAVVINLVALNVSTPPNCQVLITFSFIFSYTTFSFSSLLIVLRVIAIWNKNKALIGLATGVWGTNLSFLIRGITRIRSSWIPEASSCSAPNMESNKQTAVAMLITDIVLFCIMLVGLLRLRQRGGGMFELGRLLWKQGVIWLLIAAAAEIPPTVFVCLDLNDAFNLMFFLPGQITLSIAATRMYRSLADFVSTDITKGSDRSRRIGHTGANAKSSSTIPMPLHRMEVAVHTSYEQYSTAQTGQHVSYVGMDGQPHDKSQGLSFDSNLESGAEN